jgi:hypothetical protein
LEDSWRNVKKLALLQMSHNMSEESGEIFRGKVRGNPKEFEIFDRPLFIFMAKG